MNLSFIKKSNTLIEFIKFGIVGALNTVISYIITNGSHYVFNIHIQISNIIAFVITVFISYILNSIFVFDNKSKILKENLKGLAKAYVSYSFTGLLLTSILLYLECDVLRDTFVYSNVIKPTCNCAN